MAELNTALLDELRQKMLDAQRDGIDLFISGPAYVRTHLMIDSKPLMEPQTIVWSAPQDPLSFGDGGTKV
jgi:hypothetical protein